MCLSGFFFSWRVYKLALFKQIEDGVFQPSVEVKIDRALVVIEKLSWK